MNPVIVQRMLSTESSPSKRRYVGKIAKNGAKRRRYEEYVLKESNYVRNKQTKVRYDTQRRTEMPDEEDIRLENEHFANFLGDRYGDNKSAYNHPLVSVKVSMCDSMRQSGEEESDLLQAKYRRFQKQQSHLRALKRAIDEGYVSVKRRRVAKQEAQKRERDDEDEMEMPAKKRQRTA
jgi:hypothetical protein